MKRRRSRRLAIQGQHEVTEFIGELGDAAAAVGEIHTAAQNAGRRAGLKGDGYIGTKVSQLAGSAADLANLAIEWPVTTTIGTMLAYQTAAGLLITDTQRDRERTANRVDFAKQGMAELTRRLNQNDPTEEARRTLILDFFRCVNAHPNEMMFTKDMIFQLDTELQAYQAQLLTPTERRAQLDILQAAIDSATTSINALFGSTFLAARSAVRGVGSAVSRRSSAFSSFLFGGSLPVDAAAADPLVDTGTPTTLFATAIAVQVAIFQRNFPYDGAPHEADLQ